MGLENALQNNDLNRSSMSNSDLKKLLQTIDHLPGYIGATPFGDDESQIVMIANFIMRRFRTLQPEQIIDAFEMAACGELYEEGKRVKVTSYGRVLNIDVVGTILVAYKQHRAKEKTRPKVSEELKAKYTGVSHQITDGGGFKATPEFHYLNMLEQIEKDGELPKIHLWQTIHGYMVEKGMLPPINRAVKINRGVQSIGDSFKFDTHRMAIESYLLKNGVIKKANEDSNNDDRNEQVP